MLNVMGYLTKYVNDSIISSSLNVEIIIHWLALFDTIRQRNEIKAVYVGICAMIHCWNNLTKLWIVNIAVAFFTALTSWCIKSLRNYDSPHLVCHSKRVLLTNCWDIRECRYIRAELTLAWVGYYSVFLRQKLVRQGQILQ